MAIGLIRAGRQYYGAKAIFETMRYNSIIGGNGDFKINNNYVSRYARLFERMNPSHKGFFRKRGLRS